MNQSLENFLTTIKTIRDKENGCPWNLKQSHGSLKRYLLEELYEALEAIDEVEKNHNSNEKAFGDLKEELGDLLLQIVLHARLAEEKGFFNFYDIADQVNQKMIKRHPHVFGKAGKVETVQDVDKHWDQEKAKEKFSRSSIFEGIPKDLPALARAWLISKKAVKESFEWDQESKLFAQLDSEIKELLEVIEASRQLGKDPYADEFANEKLKQEAELELGDILFTVVNIARWFKIDPEDALRKTNNKFVKRFEIMTDLCKKQNKSLRDFSITELEDLWQQAKRLS